MPEERVGPLPPEPVKRVRADALKRAETAWQARVLGLTWDAAAQVAGYADRANCVRAVRSVYGELPTIEREEVRRLWRDRLELVWRQVVKDVHDRVPGATTAAVRVADRASRLDGLDEPQRVSVTPPDGELQRWVAEVIAIRGDLPAEPDIFDVEVIEGGD